jgi:hypothetical protein
MKIVLTLSALALMAMPAMAYSGCSDKVKEETASSCMVGQTWDPVQGACVATPSS